TPTGLGFIAPREYLIVIIFGCPKKRNMILFTTGYKNFTPTGLGFIAPREYLIVIIFGCPKKRNMILFTTGYKNFTPTGLRSYDIEN
ncbi:MAG: hypothetical protein K1X68_11850, partial [Saprospiraceae bacterium]|nr:hypothetical protein [Saprospiraceae bacterium]